MGRKIMDYAELKEAYEKLLSERLDVIELQKENERLNELVRKQRKEIIELSLLVKVSK